MKNWWSGLRRVLRDAHRRRQLAGHLRARRGELASTSEVRRLAIGQLDAEVYRLCVGQDAGVGASVYACDQELLRFDCFGPNGHFHINLPQSQAVADGRVQRIAFLSDSVEEQAAEAVVALRRNLRNAIYSNWHPDVRALVVPDANIEQLSLGVATELRSLLIATEPAGTAGASHD